MLNRRLLWVLEVKRFRQLQNRSFCSNIQQPIATTSNTTNGGDKLSNSLSKQDAYKQLDNLDFMTAAKILFSDPPKKKKFGIDFHLVQLFFACMPSLAVYLVAQYARYEMRRMEAELEQKKQAEEAAKASELKDSEEEAKAKELKEMKEAAAAANPDLVEVKVRLEKLEEAIKDIVVESKKQSGDPTKTSSADSSNREQRVSKGSGNIHDANHAPEQPTEVSHQGRTSGKTPDAGSSSKS